MSLCTELPPHLNYYWPPWGSSVHITVQNVRFPTCLYNTLHIATETGNCAVRHTYVDDPLMAHVRWRPPYGTHTVTTPSWHMYGDVPRTAHIQWRPPHGHMYGDVPPYATHTVTTPSWHMYRGSPRTAHVGWLTPRHTYGDRPCMVHVWWPFHGTRTVTAPT